MQPKKKLIKYEEKETLNKFVPYEKASGYLKDIREEFEKEEKENFSGFITTEEYYKNL